MFHNVLCVCFLALLAPKFETNAQLNPDTEKPETLFADVIKNISRVNNELQDLINNYEQFKKTQKSLEHFDDNESDTEGGRVNRNSNKSVKTQVGNKRDISGKTSTTLKYQTEMIYVEEEAGKSSEPQKSIESEKNSQSQLSYEVEKSREVDSRKPMGRTDKYKIKVQKTTTQASTVNEEPIAPKEETESKNQKFVDIHKKMKIKPDRKKRIILEAAVQQTTKKTKYSEKETQTKYLRHNSSESDSSLDIERRTEDEEVGVNKPKKRAYEKDNDGTQVTAGFYIRSENNRTNDITTIKKVDNDLTLEFTDDDEALSKDLFKTSALRQAYGDACLKLVIRKCYRACKSALTSSCQAIKCNSELKKYFDKSSRMGCIDAFKASSKGDDSYSLRRIVGRESPLYSQANALTGGIMTREGYLSAACQTQIEKPTRRMSNNTKIQNGEPLNILRDKYEKACQNISKKKCGTACQSAQTATCDKFKCRNRLKKNLKRNCRLDCKIAYSNKAQKSSVSDDNIDDDSDDDSDADSDDESEDSDDVEDGEENDDVDDNES